MTAALKGCRRVYFSMSLSPYYADAVSGGGYRGVTGQLETLLGRPPKTVRWALENHPRIRAVASS